MMMAALLAGGLVAAGCGSDVSGTGGSTASSGSGGASSGSGGASSGSGGASSSSGQGGSGDPLCPPTEPTDGAPCSHQGADCEYGQGPVVFCRGYYSCSGGQWTATMPGCSDDPGTLPGCPDAPPPPSPCNLGDGPGLCAYGDGTYCGCTNCLGGPCGGQAQWVCGPPPGGACPPTAPNFGQPCASEGAQCGYGACSLGTQAQRDCVGGVWVDIGVACPE